MLARVSRWAGLGLFVGAMLAAPHVHAAAEPKVIADALVAAIGATGKSTATYETATAAGDVITISGVKIVESDPDGSTVTIPAVVINGAAVRQPGGFTAARLSADEAVSVSEDVTFRWQTASLLDAVVPSADEIKAKPRLRPFSKLSITGIVVEDKTLPAPVTIASADVGIGEVVDGTPSDVRATVTGIKVTRELLADPDLLGIVEALGYSEFIIGATLDVGLDTVTDVVDLRSIVVDAAGVGKLGVAGKFSGVSLRAITDADTSAQAQANSALDRLSIRFDNAGVVERALDMQAKATGATSREDAAEQFVGALAFGMMMMVKNAPLEEKITAAVSAFLKAPASLTITMSPASPIQFDSLRQAVMEDQDKLVELLGLDIGANK